MLAMQAKSQTAHSHYGFPEIHPLLDSFKLVNEEARKASSPDNRRVFKDTANQGAIDGDKVHWGDPSALQDPENVRSLRRLGNNFVGVIVPL